MRAAVRQLAAHIPFGAATTPAGQGEQVPTYQYACTECGSPHEAQQSFTDEPLTVCPQCGGRLRKVFSAVGVVFKGSGFYRNDSRPEPATASADASTSDGASKTDAKPDKSSDAKPDKAAASKPGGGGGKDSSGSTSGSGTSSTPSSSGSAA
jgi:putative FmdB family regulatory protein